MKKLQIIGLLLLTFLLTLSMAVAYSNDNIIVNYEFENNFEDGINDYDLYEHSYNTITFSNSGNIDGYYLNLKQYSSLYNDSLSFNEEEASLNFWLKGKGTRPNEIAGLFLSQFSLAAPTTSDIRMFVASSYTDMVLYNYSSISTSWTMYTLTYKKGGDKKLYQNGVLISNSTHTPNNIISSVFAIGLRSGYNWNTDAFDIDRVSLLDAELTQADITGLYNSGASKSIIKPPSWKISIDITNAPSETFTLPSYVSGNYDYVVEWGDGTSNTITSWSDSNREHAYATNGTKNIEVIGTFNGIYFKDVGCDHDITITSWGNDTTIGSKGSQFYQCPSINFSITDGTTTSLTNGYRSFYYTNVIGSIESINITGTSRNEMFKGTTFTNTGGFDNFVNSDVTDLTRTFASTNFNENILNWDTSSVTSMEGLFSSNNNFNQDISHFNISQVTTMYLLMDTSYNTTTYDNILKSFNEQTHQDNVPLGMDNSIYSYGNEDRIDLINDGWTITDGGATTPSFNLTNSNNPFEVSLTTYDMDISVNIESDVPYNSLVNSEATLYYGINTSLSNGCSIVENGACSLISGEYLSTSMNKNNNTNFEVSLDDTELFPAIYPYYKNVSKDHTKNYYDLYKNNNLKVNMQNLDTGDHLLIGEISIENNSASSTPVYVYYCNNSYVSGDPNTDNNCELVKTIGVNSNIPSHTHDNSTHLTIPFEITITKSSDSFLIFESEAVSSLLGWSIVYYEDVNYVQTIFDTGNYNSWKANNNIFDLHLHQLSLTDEFYYKTSYDDGITTITNSSVWSDEYTFTNIAPYQSTIYNPCNITYTLGSDSNTEIFFNWSETTDYNDDAFNQSVSIHNGFYYDIVTDLENGTWSYNITTNKSNFLTGEYHTHITSTDTENNSQDSISFCTFNICINNWQPTYGVCGEDNLRTKTYIDGNDCPLSYDVPTDNNTQVECDYTEHLTTNGLVLIMFGILVLLIILWLIIKNPLLGVASFLISILITFYVYSNVAEGVVFVIMLILNFVLMLLSMLSLGGNNN